MAKTLEKLNALKVSRLKEPGMHHDGGGLYLQVSREGARSWIFRYSFTGKARAMGLGSLDAISLADAREKARLCRRTLDGGVDPIEERNAQRQQAVLDAAKSLTFKDAAGTYIASHSAAWKNKKHAAQWKSTLRTYVEPVFGSVAVQAVDTTLVLKALKPIWNEKTETATRIRQRIEAVLDWATAAGYRSGDNPARWDGHLDHLLPPPSKIRRVKHLPAMAYSQVPVFIAQLREQECVAARALEFTILTAARTSEVIRATPKEMSKDIWTVPPERMKAGREHRVPLCDRALEIIAEVSENSPTNNSYLFPGGKPGKPLSDMAMLKLRDRMGRSDITVHGFRSAFEDWAAEQTNYASEVRDMALAHKVGDKVKAAYLRTDQFEKRRRLMDEWARFCSTPNPSEGKVVPIRAAE